MTGLRLTPVQRLDLVEEILTLGAHALVLGGHPNAHLIAKLDFELVWRLSNDQLADGHLRLKAWIADRDEAFADHLATTGTV